MGFPHPHEATPNHKWSCDVAKLEESKEEEKEQPFEDIVSRARSLPEGKRLVAGVTSACPGGISLARP